MTNEEAIELLCAYGVPLDEEKFQEALNMAIDALHEMDFFTFLMNTINPNEMEVYLRMYNAQDDKVEDEQ